MVKEIKQQENKENFEEMKNILSFRFEFNIFCSKSNFSFL